MGPMKVRNLIMGASALLPFPNLTNFCDPRSKRSMIRVLKPLHVRVLKKEIKKLCETQKAMLCTGIIMH